MKKTLLFKSIALSLFMLFSIGILNAQNLVLNGDMEAWDDDTSPTSWTKAENITKESTIIHGGTYSAKHVGGTKDLSQTITVKPNTDYNIVIWYYVEAGDDSDARIWSYFKDASGSRLEDIDALLGPDNGYFTSAASWQKYEATVTSPADAAELYFEVRTYSSATAYWDDFSITEVSNAPVATDLFFSEYIEGSVNGNNRIIEIFNGTGSDVDLSTYSVKQSHNGTGWGVDGIAYVLPLTGTLTNGDVFVIANEGADASALAEADLTFGYSDDQGHKITFFTGDDAMGLFKDDALIDVIGVPEIDPGSGWDVAGITTATANHTLVRKGTVTEGNTDWAAAAGTDADDSEWIVLATDVISFLGEHYFGEAPVETVYAITFNVDMSLVDGFDSSSDVVYISGFPSWTEPGQDAELMLADTDGDMIYTFVSEMDIPGGDIEYKFFINAGWNTWGEWEGGDNRLATITEATVLNHIFANQGEAIILGVPFIQNFDYTTANASVSLAGWTNANIADGGALLWTAKDYSDNKYVQISSYSSTSTSFDEAWLITPGIDMDNSTNEDFSFDVNVGYWNFAGLTVKISTDFDQTVAGITTATWTDVTSDFTIPSEPTGGFGDFATAGHLDVSSYAGTMYVAFVYNGDDASGQTSTFQIDNVVIAEAGTVGFDDVLATELNIYPNPSNGKFYIEMGDTFKVNTKIEVFNVVGMKVLETITSDFKTEIDLSAMKQGVYYVRVDDGQNIITQKIMKQ